MLELELIDFLLMPALSDFASTQIYSSQAGPTPPFVKFQRQIAGCPAE
jgi:hypothetical protein